MISYLLLSFSPLLSNLEPFVQTHDSGEERFQMYDSFTSILASVFEHDSEFEYLWFDGFRYGGSLLIAFLKEFLGKHSEYHIGSNTLGQQFIEFSPDSSQLFRALLIDHIFCYFPAESFVLGTGNKSFLSKFLSAEFSSLKHHNGSS